jgi:indole-3-glycerol phosphate synthase
MRGGPATAPSGDLLATIVAATRRITEVRAEREPLASLAKRADLRQPRPGVFTAALSRDDAVNVIAECKRRSPSRGVLRADYDPVAIAASYAAAGAAAISVLTEPTFFDGALDHLERIRAAVDTALLRKDFIVSEYQLLEARASGADAALLIVAALTAQELRRLMDTAESLGLDTLVEVHNAVELNVALDAGATVIGVNNRNLRTLAVDVHASEALVSTIPADIVAVSESGLRTPADLTRLRKLGYRGFLIGERFMTDEHPGQALRTLLRSAGREPVPPDRTDKTVLVSPKPGA